MSEKSTHAANDLSMLVQQENFDNRDVEKRIYTDKFRTEETNSDGNDEFLAELGHEI